MTPSSDAGYSGSGGDGGSSDDGDNDEYDFWVSVRAQIESAPKDAVIKIRAKSYQRMAKCVMDALRNNPDVTLVINWNSGKPITIPAGSAVDPDAGRVHYPLSLLIEWYTEIPLVETPAEVIKFNPITGGV